MRVISISAFILASLYLLRHYEAALVFHRELILSGEIWRIWTGHFVHSNTLHFVQNSAAAIVIYLIFSVGRSFVELCVACFLFSGLVGITLLIFFPSLGWYNGLSGILHAFVAFYAIKYMRSYHKAYGLVLLLVWAKVIVEFLDVQAGVKNEIAGMAIVIEAHVIGAFWGSALALVSLATWRAKGAQSAD